MDLLLMKSAKAKEEEEKEEENALVGGVDKMPDQVTCMTLIKHDRTRGGEKLSNLYGQWRHEQRSRATKMERHLNAKWVFDMMIEEELSRFKAHYYHSMVPSRLGDVADILMPKWKTPIEKAALDWLGDWRPSNILGLLQSLCRAGFLSLCPRADQMLSELLNISRIEEAVLDEEMAEYQATCVLQLPFGRGSSCSFEEGEDKKKGIGSLVALQCVLKKIDGVIFRAQQLRYKAIEVVAKKLLDRTQAAEFLVAFAGIQDMIHRLTMERKLQI